MTQSEGNVAMNLLDYLILLVAEVCRIFWGRDSLAHIFLGKNITKATKKNKYASLRILVDKMTAKAKAPHLSVYVITDRYPNACTIWDIRKHYILGITSGELALDDLGELKATIGHEIGHYWARPNKRVFNIWLDIIIVCLVGVFAMLRYNSSIANTAILTIVLLVMILMIGFILHLVQFQKKCELKADIIGAKLSSVADSIRSLQNDSILIKRVARSQFLTQNWFKKLNHHILYSRIMVFINGLLQDHPTTKQRILNLKNFAKRQQAQQS